MDRHQPLFPSSEEAFSNFMRELKSSSTSCTNRNPMKELGFLRLARALSRTSRTPDGPGPALPTAPNGSSGGSRCNPCREALKPVIDCPQPTNTWPCLSLSVH